jgi:hypothetical protein
MFAAIADRQAFGVLSPVLGLAAGFAGLGPIFLISAVFALCATPIAGRLLTSRI